MKTARVIRLIFKPVKSALLALKVSGTVPARHFRIYLSFAVSFDHLVGKHEQRGCD